MIIRKRSSKRGSIATFTDQNYLGVLKKALIAGNDIKYMNRVNKSFVEGAKTLKDLRIKLNVSQSEISKMLGITQPVYSDLEQAKIKISDEIMQKVKELSMV
jgi:DNA-binding XRE family transcriptional regulator